MNTRLPVNIRLLLAALVFAAAAGAAHAQNDAIAAHVAVLASERFDGRGAGSDGERLAADYLVAELAKLGVRPVPADDDLLAPFEFAAGGRDGGSTLTVTPASGGPVQTFAAGDIQALSFSDDAKLEGAVVFAGYGIVVPESQSFGYDSYAGLDVADKIVVVLRYFPEDADRDTRAILSRYSDMRYKALAARQHGAKALLVVTGPRSPNAGELIPMSFDTALAGSGIAAASLSANAAAALFAGGPALETAQQELDSGNPHVAGFALPDVAAALETSVVRERQTARNVLAYLPATAPTDGVAKPWIVVGAHYDHLGRGDHGNSLASADEVGLAHVGADDNASGTAAVLAIAKALAAEPVRARNVLFAFWSAEEIGLVGSNTFVNAPPVPLDQIAAYVNFDMVGRMQDNKLAAQAVGSSTAWPGLLERANIVAGFDLTTQADPYQPTDIQPFHLAGVPTLNFTTGAHPDYHKPSDTADKVNYEDLARVAELGADVARRLMASAQPPPFTKVEQSSQTVSRTGVRVFTGTIPDYTSEAKGLLLGGVVGGGPAEEAGLTKGDVIVEIDGTGITNIYDYTYALELLKIDEPVKVVYERAGETREVMLTPRARR